MVLGFPGLLVLDCTCLAHTRERERDGDPVAHHSRPRLGGLMHKKGTKLNRAHWAMEEETKDRADVL